MRSIALLCLGCVSLVIVPASARAQAQTSSPATAPTSQPQPASQPAPPVTEEEHEALAREVRRLEAQVKRLKKQASADAGPVDDDEARLEALAGGEPSPPDEPIDPLAKKLDIYGFFDVELSKFWTREGSHFRGLLNHLALVRKTEAAYAETGLSDDSDRTAVVAVIVAHPVWCAGSARSSVAHPRRSSRSSTSEPRSTA